MARRQKVRAISTRSSMGVEFGEDLGFKPEFPRLADAIGAGM